jgi:hypothetical protein
MEAKKVAIISVIAASVVIAIILIVPNIPGAMPETTEDKLSALGPDVPTNPTDLLKQEWYGKYSGSMVMYTNPQLYFGGFDMFGTNNYVEVVFLPVAQEILDDSVFADLGLKIGVALVFASSTYALLNNVFPTQGTVMVCVKTSTMTYIGVVDMRDFDETKAVADSMTIIHV